MQGDSDPKTESVLKQWTTDLACPVCFATLRFSDSEVTCSGCGRVYPMVDAIPVLIPQRATQSMK